MIKRKRAARHLRIWISVFICLTSGYVRAADLKRDFKEPSLSHATRPLWFWNNTTVTEEGVVTQMREARDKSGYGGFGILPFGANFKPLYLSEEYFDLYGVALKKAKELGMTMCIYDEYGFPSGSAGAINGDGIKRFANKRPEHTLKRLDKHERDVTGPSVYSASIPEGRLMSIVAMEMDQKKRVNLTSGVKDGKVSWPVPPGHWKIMIFVCVKDGDPNVDYLDPRAVEHFVEMTHQQYYNRFKEYFGDTVDGTFFDEPTLYRAKGRPWTGAFNEKFIAAHGFDPAPYYPALWYDIGAETQAARNYLFGFRSELYAAGFPKVIQEWCARHGITATGHQDNEEMVNPVGTSGDLMKCFKYQDIPGIDKIGGDRPAERFYKVISSAAYNWDKGLIMSETYGAMGDIAWETIYQVAMEQYTKGVNQLIPHAVWYDSEKVSFKPELSWRHDKYAKGLPQYNKYMSRLNLLLQNHDRHVADIAVLYPIATMQAGHYLDGPLGFYGGGVAIPEADYVDVGELLATQVGRDYTFIHPEVLDEKCGLIGDTLRLDNRVNYEEYKVMIVPGHKTIYWSNLKKIKEFYDRGGKVIATGTLPSKSAEFGHDKDVVDTIAALFPGVENESNNFTVTASSFWPGYGPENAGDGNNETRWNAKDGNSEDQWLEIDFGKSTKVNRAEIHENFDRITSYNIQYLKGDKWVDCAGGTTLGDKTHDFNSVTASKVRLYIHSIKSDSVSISEFSVTMEDGKSSEKTKPPTVSRNKQGGMAVFLRRPNAERLRETLDNMLDVYDVEFEIGKELRYIHKVRDGMHIYFFSNLGETPIAASVELRGALRPELWDPHTGDVSKAEYSHEKRGDIDITKVKMELAPIKSLFILAKPLQD